MVDESVTITPASLEDIPAVADLCVSVERQHEAYWPLRWQLRDDIRERFLRWLTANIDEPRWLILTAHCEEQPRTNGVAVSHPQILAGILIAAIQDEIPIYAFNEYAFIHDMAVRPEYRRRGIAHQMLQMARQWADSRGVNQIRGMVAVHNPLATALFQRCGYRPSSQEMVLKTKQE